MGTHTITLKLSYDNGECETTKSFKDKGDRIYQLQNSTAPDTICVQDPLIVTYAGTKSADLVLNWSNTAVRTDLETRYFGLFNTGTLYN